LTRGGFYIIIRKYKQLQLTEGFMLGRSVSNAVLVVAVTGLMIALTAVMSFTPLGTIPLPAASVTIAFLPAMATAMLVGLYPGLIVAAFAGIFTLIRAYFVVTLLAPFLQNPLISVVPRMMIAVTVFVCFKALSKTKLPKVVSVAISAGVGSITNTVGVLGLTWLVYAERLGNAVSNIGHVSVWAFMVFVITTNAILELAVNIVLCTAVVLALRRAKLYKL
jgi:uncharacterized membrane protein